MPTVAMIVHLTGWMASGPAASRWLRTGPSPWCPWSRPPVGNAADAQKVLISDCPNGRPRRARNKKKMPGMELRRRCDAQGAGSWPAGWAAGSSIPPLGAEDPSAWHRIAHSLRFAIHRHLLLLSGRCGAMVSSPSTSSSASGGKH